MQIYPYSTTYFCSMEMMKISIVADDEAFSELEGINGVEWKRVDRNGPFREADALMWLADELPEQDLSVLGIPVILNSVTTTLHEMKAGGELVRINGWPGFLSRNIWEVSGLVTDRMTGIFEKLGKTPLPVADEPGLVTARVISMIINEAYFALEEKVSSRDEIDIALRLGTNYPYGPFEWSRKIGLKNICTLLDKLGTTDDKYAPSPLLKKEAQD